MLVSIPSQHGRRVVVTGLGVVGPCGIGKDAFFEGLCGPAPEGERRVHDFDPSPYFGPKEVRRADRFTQFAVAAAEEARADADSSGSAVAPDPERAGVWVGTGVGGLATLEREIVVHHEKGPKRVNPFLVPMMMNNAAAAALSMRYGWRGPCENTVTACAAGTQSITNGARLIASGRCDVVLAGSAEAPMTPVGITAFDNMTALSKKGFSRPFDKERDGFVISEGAGILVLEELEAALARGARIYAEVLGGASTADAHHITAPAPGGQGAISCMEQALADAGVTSVDVRHINAHGTSTPLNDLAEAEAMAKVFGPEGPPVTSTKGVTGHALGAAGSLEAVAALLTIDRRLIPPTAGYRTPDPEMPPMDLVLHEPREWEPGVTLSNSFGFGGHNGTVVFAPYRD